MKLKILFLQLPNPLFCISTHNRRWGGVPLAAGYLKGMLLKNGLLDEVNAEIAPYKSVKQMNDRQLIEYIKEEAPDILAFSLYCWNTSRSLFIAGEIKKQMPGVKVMVGGPEISEDNNYILSSPVVDLGCSGEGELTIVELVKALLSKQRDLSKIKGIFYRDGGRIVFTPPREPIEDINIVPSPYINGILDPRQFKRIYLETGRGCHRKCKYCSWEKRPLSKFDPIRVGKELQILKDAGIQWLQFIDSDIMLSLAKGGLGEEVEKVNKDWGIIFDGYMSAEMVTEEKAELLWRLGFRSMGIGLQSTNPDTLNNIGRKPNLEKFVRGCKILREHNIWLQLEFIVGLPYDHITDIENIYRFIDEHKLGRDNTMPFRLLVLPGTALRREAESFSIKYSKEPPYNILDSSYISSGEIRKAMSNKYPDPRGKIHYSFIDSYLSKDSVIENQRLGAINSPDIIGRPEKIVLDLDHLSMNTGQYLDLSRKIIDNIACPTVIWLKAKNIKDHMHDIADFLRNIVSENPYIFGNLLVETATVPDIKTVNAFIDLPFADKQDIDGKICKAFFLSFIFPWDKKSALDEKNLEELRKSYHCFWSVDVDRNENGAEKVRETLWDTGASGCVIGISSPENDLDNVNKLLDVSINSAIGKVHFRNAELNYVAVFLRMNYNQIPQLINMNDVSEMLGFEDGENDLKAPLEQDFLVCLNNDMKNVTAYTPVKDNNSIMKNFVSSFYKYYSANHLESKTEAPAPATV